VAHTVLAMPCCVVLQHLRQMPDRSAQIRIQNKAGTDFKFQVLHQYTGDSIEESKWHLVQHDSTVDDILTVHYRTGFFTTGTRSLFLHSNPSVAYDGLCAGVDNWIVNGIELRKLAPEAKVQVGGATLNVNGTLYLDLKKWRSWHGAFSSWKVFDACLVKCLLTPLSCSMFVIVTRSIL
jgi:hypothetical protein